MSKLMTNKSTGLYYLNPVLPGILDRGLYSTPKMASEIGESVSRPPESSSCGDNGTNDAGDFECNICFELAEDPIVTLCGHLYCWPCLYKWLHVHSYSQECPVCKALIEEEKLVPLYGRGKTPTDPRSKPIPGLEIPRRPAGQRPPTAPSPEANNIPNFVFMWRFVPMATARFGNFATSAGIGELFQALVDIRIHGFQNATAYGTRSGYAYRFPAFHGGHLYENPHTSRGHQENNYLKTFLLIVGVFVILGMIL